MQSPNFTISALDIETPLVNAAGSINGTSSELILREVETLADTAIGAITVGSFTVPKQFGNEAKYGWPTYYHDKKTGTTYNSMALPNIGLYAAMRLMPEIISRARDKGKPVIASVSPTISSPESGGNAFEQVKQLVEGLIETGVDLIEVDTSCPNIVTENGARKPILGYDHEAMEELLSVILDTAGARNLKVGLKLPPYLSNKEKLVVPQLKSLFRRYRDTFNFIVTSNAIPNQVAYRNGGESILTVPGGAGGMSGPSTKEVGRQQLRMWHDLMGDGMDIISTLGVHSGKELAVRRQLGAAAAGGVTFLWESNDWGRAVTNVISDWVTAEEQC